MEPAKRRWQGSTTAVISGKEDYWQWTLDSWKRRSEWRYVSPDTLGLLYASHGEKDKAFEWLGKAYQASAGHLFIVVNSRWPHPAIPPLRDHPRFQDLLLRMNFEL